MFSPKGLGLFTLKRGFAVRFLHINAPRALISDQCQRGNVCVPNASGASNEGGMQCHLRPSNTGYYLGKSHSVLGSHQRWLTCTTPSTTQFRGYRSGHSRSSSEDKTPQPQASPQLMEFPWVIWPSLWHTVRNWIFANLIIRPYLDKDFSLSTFKSGAIQALCLVSQELSKGNFPALDGLVVPHSLAEVKTNFRKLSLKQRLDLGVVADDIFFSFPYQIGVIFANEGGPEERVFVEITMCYHVFKGFQDHLESAAHTDNNIRGVYENYDRISIANYRFIREFTKGVEDEWTINIANHFKPGEYIQER